MRGRQRFQCLYCGRQFILKRDKTSLRKKLWKEYVWHRQTLTQMADRYGRTVQWVQRQLDAAPISSVPDLPQRIIAVTDTTFFGRGYGILVVRCPRLKKNVHVHELQLETPAEYHAARASLETQGFISSSVNSTKSRLCGGISPVVLNFRLAENYEPWHSRYRPLPNKRLLICSRSGTNVGNSF